MNVNQSLHVTILGVRTTSTNAEGWEPLASTGANASTLRVLSVVTARLDTQDPGDEIAT